MLLGCVFRTDEQVATVSWIPPILMAALGGCWWPREILPEYLNRLSYIFPTSSAMDGLHKIISFGGDATSVLPEAAALSGFFVLFLVLSVKFTRFE